MARFNLQEWMQQEQGKHRCQCGCGQCITIQRHHHARGIPEFINGHAARVQNPMSGKTGVLNPHYKAGRYVNQGGYIVILNPQRTGHRDRYILEHRYVMEQYLGRKLTADEQVHHRNGDKTDNRLSNLEVLNVEAHAQRHDAELRAAIGDAQYLQAKRRIHRGESYKELLCRRAS